MKNIKITYIIFAIMLVFSWNIQESQAQCTVPITPTNIVVTETGPGQVSLSWDLDCGTRTECGANESLFWYVGFYGQNSPSQNGILGEYATSNALTCDAPAGDVVGAPITSGGDIFGDGTVCLDQKGSTCYSGELGQLINGGCGPSPHTWNVAGMCSAEGAQNFLFDLCPGQCYNVFMWELVVGVPTNSGGNTNLNNCGIELGIACGEIPFIAESPVSDVVRICLSGDNELIGIPTVSIVSSSVGTTGGAAICATSGQSFVGEWEAQPEDEGDAAQSCVVQDIDDETGFDAATCNVTDSASGTQTNNGNGGDVSVTFTAGTGNSANGDLTLGTNVMEVNCRDVLEVGFSTPVGCNGVNDLNVFGLPICPGYDDTYTDAIIYISNNGIPINPNASNTAYPACVAAGDANTGDPGENGTIQCQNGSNTSGVDYPANWSAQFGAFLNAADNCVFPIAGNPFDGGGSPFDFAGVTTQDFGDGVLRQVSTICVRYEDLCDGSKSATCVKFISDASPITASVSACNETCPGAADGALVVHDIAGGSDDPDGNSVYTDGNMGAYILDVIAGPVTGQIFTYAGGSSWQATGLPPGVYTIDVYDSLAPNDTFDADPDDDSAVCGAACPAQLVVEILAGPILPVIPTVTQPTCTTDGTASIVVDKISTFANGQAEFCSGPGASPGDFVTPSAAATTVTSGLFAGCPSDAFGPTSVVEICIDNFTAASGDLSGTQLLIGINGSGPNLELNQGGAFGNGGTLAGASVTACFSITYNGTSIPAFFAGFPANGFTLEVHANDGFGSGDTYTFDDLCITINDQMCVTESNITAFCDDLGPDNGDGAGAITSTDQTLTWASSNGVDTGAEPAFDFITLAGPGENDATFDNQAALDAGVAPGTSVCYSITGYVPGNEFDNVNAITDNTGFLNDLGVGTAAAGCYAGVCCEVIEEVCFTVFPKPLAPTSTPVCSCEGEPVAAMMATGMCDPTQETESSGVINGDGTVVNSPFGLPGGYTPYTVVGPSDPACSGVADVILVSGPDNVGITLNGGQIYADGPGFGGAVPAYGTAVVVGIPVAPGDLFEVYGFDGGLNPADASFQVNITYTCPAATPAYTWYGDDGDSDGVLPDPTLGTVVGSGAAYNPAAGDVDMFGNAFDPAACGNYTYCATVDCNGCIGDAECFIYTVNPSQSGAAAVDLGEICEGDDVPVADLAGQNGGALNYDICEDMGLSVNCVTVTDGMFTIPQTAVGTYTYYYTGEAVPCTFPGFTADAACVCSPAAAPITLIINAVPAPSACGGPNEICAGDVATNIALTATCANCPDVPEFTQCTDPCDATQLAAGCMVTTETVTETGTISFSQEYDAATNGGPENQQTLAIMIMEPNVPPCCDVTFEYQVDYTIDPFTPSMGISWTSEASFTITDLAGTILASGGPNLPGSATNGTPITGSTGLQTATATAGSFAGGVILAVEDNFDDAAIDGTFSGTLTYTLTIENCSTMGQVQTGTITGPAAGVQWCTIDFGADGALGGGDDTETILGTNATFDPRVDDPNFDETIPGNYTYYSACICGTAPNACPSTKTACLVTVVPDATANAGGDIEICDGDVVSLSGTLTNNDVNGAITTGMWSGGAGTFTAPTSLNTDYNYTAAEVGTTVTLTFTPDAPANDLTPSCVVADMVDVTINPLPAAPTGTGAVTCQNSAAATTIAAATCTVTNWYTAATGGASVGMGSPFDPTTATSGAADLTTPGDYSFFAECTDANGCIGPRTEVVFTVPPIIGIATPANVCTAGTNGGIDLNQITVNVTGGLPSITNTSANFNAADAYTFGITGAGAYNPGTGVTPDTGTTTDPGTFVFTDGANGIPPGVYTVSVTDASGCSFDFDVNVYDELFVAAQSEACGPNQFIVTFGDGGTDPQIFGGACYDFYLVTNPTDITTTFPTGTITAYSDQDPTGVIINAWPYTICEPIPAPGGTTIFFDFVPDGDVYIILVDDNGCETSNQVGATPPLAYDPISLTDVSEPCDNNALTILMDDGRSGAGFLTDAYFTSGFTAAIIAGPSNVGATMGATSVAPGDEGQGTATFSGLSPGIYTIEVTDVSPPAALCPNEPPFTEQIMVNVYDPVVANNIIPFCDDANGSRLTFSFDVAGGLPGFNSIVGTSPLTNYTVTNVTVAPTGGTGGDWDITQDTYTQDVATGTGTFTFSMEPATSVGTVITIDLVDENGCTTTIQYTTTFQCCIAEAGGVFVGDICAPETATLDCANGSSTDNPDNPLPSTATLTITGYQNFNLYNTYVLVTDQNGNILDVVLVATGNTGAVPGLVDIDVEFTYCYFANLAGGGLGQTYEFYSYNELDVNPPDPAPIVGLNVDDIGTIDDVCYDISATLAPLYVPKPLTVACDDQADEGNLGGITPFYYNRHEICIEGGTPPYSYAWCTQGYVRHAESTVEFVNGCPTTNISIEYNDNAVWAVTITDGNSCTLNNWRFTNDPIVEDAQQGLAVQAPGSQGSVLDAFYDEIIPASDCYEEDGSIKVCLEGGTGMYTYNWTGPFTWNEGPILGLTANDPNHPTITVEDGSSFFSSFAGGAPPTDPSHCHDGQNLAAIGTNNCITLTGLTQGWYTLTVTDAGGATSGNAGNPNTGPGNAEAQESIQWYWVHCNFPYTNPNGTGTGGRGKVANLKTEGGIAAYPNPFSTETTIEFAVTKTEKVEISMFSVDGKQTAHLFKGKAKSGEVYSLPFQSGALPSGVYVVRMTTESGVVKFDKLLITK